MRLFPPILVKIVAVLLAFTLCGCASGGSGSGAVHQSTGTLPAEDVDTLSVGAVIVARDSVNEDEIYDFVSTLFEHRQELEDRHPIGALLDLNYAASVTQVPYHPGAARYFAEHSLEVPVKEGAGTGSKADLTMGTGNNGGNYYSFGSTLAGLMNERCSFTVTARNSAGSVSNLEDLENDRVQVCFVQADLMSYCYGGTRLFSTPSQDFSVVAALYEEHLQILTNDPELHTVDQLAGKRVSIGVSGSGVYFNALDVLSAYGLSESDFQPVYEPFGDSAESLREGSIDAAFIVAGVPTPAVAGLVGECQLDLVAMDQEHIRALIADNPFYTASTIPAGSY